MVARKLNIQDSAEDTVEEHINSLTLFKANPIAAPLVPKFEALVADVMEVNTLRIQLLVALASATAKAFYLDAQLNDVVDELVNGLQKVTKRQRNDPLWTVYFKNKEPNQFKRPILSDQLAAMSAWPSSLASSPHEPLKAVGAKLEPLLLIAVQAEKDVLLAKQNVVEFRNIGRWRQHIDKANAERQAAYGFLAEIPHKNPDLKLPAGFADLFFLHDTSRRGGSAARGLKEVDADILELEEKLAALNAERKAAEAQEQADLAAAAQLEADRAALALAEQKKADAEAEAQALKKKLKASGVPIKK
jgi:hypothetical protein